MPSPLELLEHGDAHDGPPSPPPAEVLGWVKVEGARRRTIRRRRNLGLAVLGLALLLVPTAVLRGGDGGGGDQELNVAADAGPSSTDTSVESTSLPDLAPVTPVTEPPTTAPTLPTPTSSAVPTSAPTTAPAATAPPTTKAPATTTTAKACRNSLDPACGAFRWDPAPSPNQPLTAQFTAAPATAVVGQPVTFEVTWADGDAALSFENFSTDGTAVISSCSMVPRYGPWTPPARVPSGGTRPYTTTFTEAREYKIAVSLATADCTSPYSDDTVVETTVTVTAA